MLRESDQCFFSLTLYLSPAPAHLTLLNIELQRNQSLTYTWLT